MFHTVRRLQANARRAGHLSSRQSTVFTKPADAQCVPKLIGLVNTKATEEFDTAEKEKLSAAFQKVTNTLFGMSGTKMGGTEYNPLRQAVNVMMLFMLLLGQPSSFFSSIPIPSFVSCENYFNV